MNLLTTLGRQSPNKIFVSLLSGAVAGICYAFLIPIVVSALSTHAEKSGIASAETTYFLLFEVANFRFAIVFLILCLVILVARTLSRILLVNAALDLTSHLRMNLCSTVLRTPLVRLEKIGPARLEVILTEDVRRVVGAAQLLPILLINAITVVGMLGFLLFLSFAAFKFIIAAIFWGIVTYQIPLLLTDRLSMKSRYLVEELQQALHGIIYGTKELKINAKRRQQYWQQILQKREHALNQSEKRLSGLYVAASSYGDMIAFFVIGIVAFIFVNYHALDEGQLVAIIMTLLYVTGPIAAILGTLPQIAIAKASMKNIHAVFGRIDNEDVDSPPAPAPAWSTITLDRVSFQYERGDKSEGFDVGPVSLEIRKGEITFFIGGNGSGKSTLGKILTLHYFQSSGSIYFDEHLVTDDSREPFRQDICAIFTDYYLFDRLLDELSEDQVCLAHTYLQELGLGDKVTLHDGKFSTLALSDGQRKRLSLLVGLLDKKQLYVFDEWAADQDPVFKDVFYKRILPDLRAQNKAVVVISHDDRYFDIADRLFVMSDGVVVDSRTPELVEARVAV